MKIENAAVARIKDAINELPREATKALLSEIDSSSPFGSAIHQNGGTDLEQYMALLSPEDMSIASERILEASYALADTLQHRPHFGSLLEIINGAAHATSDEQAFMTMLQTVTPALPGVNSAGEPMAQHHIYQTQAETPVDSVMSQAREAIDDPQTSEEDRQYWLGQVYKTHPELRGQDHLTGNDIPLDSGEVQAGENAANYNRELGKSAGILLQTLGYGNRSGMPTDDDVLTVERAQELNAADEADSSIMRPADWAENAIESDDSPEVAR